jgi:hypothetical protein
MPWSRFSLRIVKLRAVSAARELGAPARHGGQRNDPVRDVLRLLFERDRWLHVSHRTGIARPLFVVSTSLMQVFIGEAGQLVQHDPARFRRRFRQVVPRQFRLAAAWIAAANLAAGWAFPILFGQQWDPAIPYLHALSAGYMAVTVLHLVSTSLQIMERQALAAAWQTGRLVVVVISVIVPWRLGLGALPAVCGLRRCRR